MQARYYPFQWRRSTAVIATATLLLLISAVFLLYSRQHIDISPIPNAQSPPYFSNSSTCHVDLDLLRTHASNSSAEYARLEISVVRTKNFTGFSDSLDVPVPTYQTVQLDTKNHTESLPEEKCATSVTIHAPVAVPRPNASHLIFGVATSTERLYDSLDAFAHWAGGTNAHIVAVVDDEGSVTQSKKRAKELDIRLTVIQNSDDLLDRYFSLLRTLFERKDELTQWIVLIDDDTFFPSMTNLVQRLATYDPTEPQYIGALTEDIMQMYHGSHMAYGGAGIFLSIPLVRQLNAVFRECYDFKGAGDRMIARCIYSHTTTKLKWEPGLHQLDLRGDASGFYESGRPLPLSLHHWKSWFHVDMVALSKVAAICGEACLLRRWELSDDWYLINGFSVVKYSLPLQDPNSMEQTWDNSKYKGPDPFEYSLGPLRSKDEGKVSFRLKEAIAETDRVRQIYVRKQEKPQVIEVVWSLSH
ncbi:hypothetical protein BDV41DRAFT_100469 [Aspergillus transmontanensis]|uniref:Glycosyltransferase family 31 protein n=1 Tax=Aspergillus transmontanensis TaxID=1034304 RepID=A0A5N6VE19_9EURO|nr:hypothetical protein BDV41DRAFT_100469 [Aspergillus transmontanensis]